MLETRQSFTFVWGFTLGDTTTISQCTPASVFVNRDPENGSSPQPVPPYTLIAYPDQGVPTVDLLGTGPNDMLWSPRFPAGTNLLISIVDALGNSGGVAQNLYTVASSATSSCIAPASSSDLKVTIDNTPSTIQTCQTVPIRIQGGQKPYTITIAATNASTATNATMDARNDYYQYINRVPPGQSMIAAISDSTGKYAASTQFYTTAGSTDITCGGQTSIQSVYDSSGSSSAGSSPTTTSGGSSQTSAASGDSNKGGGGGSLTGAIIGTILGLLAILGLIAYFFFRRRNSRQAGANSTHNSGGGFGMKDYKRGGNMPGNESFLPLSDGGDLPRTPNAGSPQTAFGPPGSRQSAMDYYSAPSSNYGQSMGTSAVSSSQTGSPAQTAYGPPGRRQSAMDYYSAPSSNYGQSVGTSVVSSSQTGLSQSTMPPPPFGMSPPAGAGRPLSKREMMLRDQQRQQQWSNANQPQERPESMYPPVSSYTVNPFGDNTYPYNPASQFGGGGAAPPTHSHAPSRSFGSTVALGLGTGPGTPTGPSPASYKASPNPSHAGTGMAPRPSGSQDLSTMSAAMGAGMTPAARTKATEAAQAARRAYADEDDDDLLAYTQPRVVLGVTNPDRASVATSNTTASADPYGGTVGHVGGASTPTQIYQHEDAGGIVELPPAYREFSKTPGPGSAPRR